MEYYSAIKNEILLFVTTWMDLCKVKDYRKTDSDFMYVWNLKNKTSAQKKKTTKQKQTQRYREKLRVARGKGVEEMGKIGEGD